MALNTNINPYYDDFDEFKNFHQLLFKPGYAVQARELTQLQTIIQDQIKKFGNHVFQQGSVVIPGNSFGDLTTPYVKLDTSFNGQEVNRSEFLDKIVVGATTGIRAVVRETAAAVSTDPLTFYLSYLSGSSDGLLAMFQPGEEIFLETNSTLRATVKASLPTGYGSLAFVKTGVFFVNGRFVTVKDSTTIISKYTSTPSCRVLLKIVEEIITSNEDDTLLDPASGSYNFAGPGADRYKISLELTSLPLSTELDDNYIEIMRYNAGVLEEHARYPKYSELEKSLARRTYDESGDYIVNGFRISVNEHYKTKYNDGMFETGDRDKFVYKLDPGKAYIKGFEVEKIAQTILVADKARTEPNHVKLRDYIAQPLYGQYIYVTNLVKLPNFRERETVTLMSASTGGTSIGTMYVYAIDLLEGDASGQNAVYKLYYHDVNLSGTNKLKDVGRITYGSGGSARVLTKLNFIGIGQDDFKDVEDEPNDVTVSNTGNVRTAKAHRFVRADSALFVYRHDSTKSIPAEGDFITGGTSGTATVTAVTSTVQQGQAPLMEVKVDSLKSIKNLSETYSNLVYYVWTNINVPTDGSGNGTASISNGEFVTPDTGIIVAAGPSGAVAPSKISLQSPTVIKITAGPVSQTVNILAQVKRDVVSAVAPKTKVLTTLTLTNVAPTRTISLTRCDVYDVLSVTDASGNDLTSRCKLDNGQRDFFYGIGTITINGTLPTTNLSIQFRFFDHTGSGDFFSVDSYTTLGSEYINKVPEYRSTNTSKIYNLRNFLDFRPKVDGSTGLFTGGNASLSDFPVIDSMLSTPVQYYVPRIDSIVLSKGGALSLLAGTPAEIPKKQSIPTDSIELYSSFVPAYTTLAKDVVTNLSSTRRYTMKDIAVLEKRVETVERLSIINVEENSVINTEVLDPVTGLNKFKSGYLVDGFTNPFATADIDKIANISGFYGRKFGPKKEGFVADYTILSTTAPSGSTNIQNTNGQITLPYTEVAFIDQPYSTKTVTLNPFSAISWEGVLKINPQFDLSAQNIGNSDNNIVSISQPIEPEVKPPEKPPEEPRRPPAPVQPTDPAEPPSDPLDTGAVPVYTVTADKETMVWGEDVVFTLNIKNGKGWKPPVNWGVTTFNTLVPQWFVTGVQTNDLRPEIGYTNAATTGSFTSVTVNDYTVTVTVKTHLQATAPSAAIGNGTVNLKISFNHVEPYSGGKNILLGEAYVLVKPTAVVVPAAIAAPYPLSTRVGEGDNFILTIVGDIDNPSASVPSLASRVVTWAVAGTGADSGSGYANSNDVILSSGSMTLTGNPATDRVTITVKQDALTEGNEVLQTLVEESISGGGSRQVSGKPVTIVDTSTSPPLPDFVDVEVFARDLGRPDGFTNGVINNNKISIKLAYNDYNKITTAMSGAVVDATINPQGWSDRVALVLLSTTEVGSSQWDAAVQNATIYLRGLGKTDTQINQILDSAYQKAKTVLGR